MKRIRKTGKPVVLIAKGKAEAVLPDAAAYRLDAVARIRRGLAQAKRGQGGPVDGVFDELEREF
jgi:hypothetical protein